MYVSVVVNPSNFVIFPIFRVPIKLSVYNSIDRCIQLNQSHPLLIRKQRHGQLNRYKTETGDPRNV